MRQDEGHRRHRSEPPLNFSGNTAGGAHHHRIRLENGQGLAPATTEPGRHQGASFSFATRSAMWRPCCAEFMGSFYYSFVSAAGSVVSVAYGSQLSEGFRSLILGLTLLSLNATLADVSGAHFNPGTTLMFALRGAFPWRALWVYWLAQFAGGIAGAALCRALLGNINRLGGPYVHDGVSPAQTYFLVMVGCHLQFFVSAACAVGYRIAGRYAPVAVGSVVALLNGFLNPVTGGGTNLQSTVGAMTASVYADYAWIFVTSPIAGSVLAVLTSDLLYGPVRQKAAWSMQANGIEV